jgi:hypothetical protein
MSTIINVRLALLRLVGEQLERQVLNFCCCFVVSCVIDMIAAIKRGISRSFKPSDNADDSENAVDDNTDCAELAEPNQSSSSTFYGIVYVTCEHVCPTSLIYILVTTIECALFAAFIVFRDVRICASDSAEARQSDYGDVLRHFTLFMFSVARAIKCE